MYILQSAGYIDEEIRTSYDPNHYDELECPRPVKYENLMLPPYWYSSVHRKKFEKERKHRKIQGSISKADLTAMISKSWREIDPTIHEYCKRLANAEKMKRKRLKENKDQAEAPSEFNDGSTATRASVASQVKTGEPDSSMDNPIPSDTSNVPESSTSSSISPESKFEAAASSSSVLDESILALMDSDAEFQESLNAFDQRIEASLSSSSIEPDDLEDDFNRFNCDF